MTVTPYRNRWIKQTKENIKPVSSCTEYSLLPTAPSLQKPATKSNDLYNSSSHDSNNNNDNYFNT